jgi:hypothetical protein
MKKYTEKRERKRSKCKEKKEGKNKKGKKERKTFHYSATDVINSSEILSLYSLHADIDKTYYI